MGFWRIIDEHSLSGLTELVPIPDYALTGVAALLAVFSACTLLPTLARVRSADNPASRLVWHYGGAVTMGIGFWGTQNMALLALKLPAAHFYQHMIGLAALLPAVAGCAAMIHALSHRTLSARRLHQGALSFALGIAALHYVLMEAIRGEIVVVYDVRLFAASLLSGYGIAWLALYTNKELISARRHGWKAWLAGSLLLGAAMLASHYAASAGTSFFDNGSAASTAEFMRPGYVIPALLGSVLFLIAAYWFGTLVDGRLAEAGEAVRASEVRHRAVVAAMLDAHLITDWQGIVRAFNPAAEQTFGWHADEIIGQPVTRLMKEVGSSRKRDWAIRDAKGSALAATPRRWVYPDGGRRKDGSKFPIEISFSPFQANGEQLFSCVIRDLSDRWAFEARLRRLDAAIEQAGDAILLLGPDRRIEYVNPQYERQTGYSPDEVIGRQPSRASEAGVYDDIWASVEQGRTWSGQVRTRRRDGSVCEEDLSLTPVVDGEGAVKGYVAVMRDITRRLEADLERRRLAEALQHCTDSIEILDSQGRIVYVNAAFEAGAGQRLVDIRGSRPEALMDFSADAAAYEDMMRTAYRGGRPWSGTLKAASPAGDIREEDITVSPMRDNRGQVNGYVVVKRDATDRRRQETQARQRQSLENIGHVADDIAQELDGPMQHYGEHLQLLRKSFHSLDQLLAELTAFGEGSVPVPPAAIRGCMQSADVEFLRRQIAGALEQSGAGAERVAGVVGAIREIAHTGAGKTDVDLNRTIQSTIMISRGDWQPVAEVKTEFDASLPPVRCMPGEISLVVFNMLVQAVQATVAAHGVGIRGKSVITVSTRRVNDWAEIRIHNTGNGITPELRQKMFAAPGEAAGAQDLTLAHDIVVRKHHGTISLDSEPVHGATFIIRLPIETSADTSATSTAAA